VQEKLDTYPGATNRAAQSVAFEQPRDAALDRDRRASMADEGGVAAAEFDLNEQLATTGRQPLVAAWYDRRGWRGRVFWSAVAFGVAAAFARALRHGEKRRVRSRSLLQRMIGA
jgi:hypothetical protein